MYRANTLTLIALWCLALPVAHATWYGENVDSGADIMMMDIRYPWWAETLYNAHWNFALDAPGGFSGYGGFTMGVPAVGPDYAPDRDAEVQAAYRPGSVWSFWGSNAEGEPVRVVEASRYTYPRQYIGEGASGSLGGISWPFVTLDRWYTTVLRVWRPVDPGAGDVSYIGRWVKDVEAGEWHLYGIVRIPAPATAFTGNAGFLEDFGNGGRSASSVHRRRGYFRKDGLWHQSDTVTYAVPAETGAMNTYWVVSTIEDDQVLAMERTSNPRLLPQELHGDPLPLGQTYSFTVRQPDKPELDRPAVDDVEAVSNGQQVLTTWHIPDAASPQLRYRVEVFDNPACAGDPVAVREERMPTVQSVLIDAPVAAPTVRLSVSDVFDQEAEPVVVTAEAARPPAPATAVETAPGLEYQLLVQDSNRQVNVYYPPCARAEFSANERHYWVSLAELEGGRLAQQGTCRGFDTELRGARAEGYGFRFRGVLRVPATGIYLFRMAGSEGYRIAVDNGEVLTWDGLHGPERRTLALSLAAGDHPLAVDYFVDRQPPYLELEWQGPGLERQAIPPAALLHEVVGTAPAATLHTKAHPDGSVSTSVDVIPNGHVVDRIELFLDKMQLAEVRSSTLEYSALVPAGDHHLWSRVYYDGDHTLDSEITPITVGSAGLEGWQLGVAGEAASAHNILQAAPNAFAFVGEGEYTLYRTIEGDFTLTARVDQCLGSGGEPVNPSSWVGLSVREHAEKPSYQWGGEFGVFQTAGYGLRTTPDFSDLGGTRMSLQTLPDGQPWLRVVRQGALWTAWSSVDGEAWVQRATHYKPLLREVGAGVVFRALPQDARMYFRAAVSDVSLVAGVPEDLRLPDAEVAGATSAADLTGIAVAASDPRVVVVRSATRGLIRSDDGGQTWREANGALGGAANAVRSVAIHPVDPSVMLRAAGTADAQGAFGGGLYRTEDAGVTWTRVNFAGDFDGVGPSALCGEVIAFVPSSPDTVIVGCETRGLFRSEDGGTTWQPVGGAGERFTAVAMHPWDLTAARESYGHAVTCSDEMMPTLGRGAPLLRAGAAHSRDYATRDSGRTFTVQAERTDLGLLSLAFPDYSAGGILYGTTQGVCSTFTDGRESYLTLGDLPVESGRPTTALGVSRVRSQTWPRTYAQALSPATPGRASRLDYSRDGGWVWQSVTGAVPTGPVAIVAGDLSAEASGDDWWYLAADGLYQSHDNLATLVRVLQ